MSLRSKTKGVNDSATFPVALMQLKALQTSQSLSSCESQLRTPSQF